MEIEKIYAPETIPDTWPDSASSLVANTFGSDTAQSQGNNTVTTPGHQVNQTFPPVRVARHVISDTLDTLQRKVLGTFEFAISGALQIGQYVNGESGDLRISANGLTARNVNGTTTFAIDATTGNAVFAGELQAGTVIADVIEVGSDSILIDGVNGQFLFYVSGIPQIVIGNV